jgi:hypothetical protein
MIPDGTNGRQLLRSSMTFDEAFEIFNSFFPDKGFTHQENKVLGTRSSILTMA